MLNAILRAATPSPCALPSGTLVAAQPSGLLECHGHGLSPLAPISLPSPGADWYCLLLASLPIIEFPP
jgi:hypothetical protein